MVKSNNRKIVYLSKYVYCISVHMFASTYDRDKLKYYRWDSCFVDYDQHALLISFSFSFSSFLNRDTRTLLLIILTEKEFIATTIVVVVYVFCLSFPFFFSFFYAVVVILSFFTYHNAIQFFTAVT